MPRYRSLPCATALSILALALAAPAPAWEYEDDASQAAYSDGLADGENENTGTSSFDAWFNSGYGGAVTVESSADDGGAGVIDVGGVSWKMQTDGGTIHVARRGFPSPQPAGTKISMTLESGTTTSTDYVAWGALRTFGPVSYVRRDETSSFWQIDDDSTTVTTIPATTPIRVTWTLQAGATYDVELQPLPSGTAFVSTGRTHDAPLVKGTSPSSDVTGVEVRARDFDATPSTPVTLYFNSLITDPTGTLPVELDTFGVE